MHIKLVLLLALRVAGQGVNPPVVDPGSTSKAPGDAIVLLDASGGGADLWRQVSGGARQWPVENGVMTCKTGSGDLVTNRTFGSAQIHLEFRIPDMPAFTGQAKGNSGVYIQGRYEIQILDSYRNPTYPDGSAAAIYGQHAPLVNASRPPGEWQSYDIVFRAPVCDGDGRVRRAGTVTLLHNGVLVQDHSALAGPTPGGNGDVCQPGPLLLQDHYVPNVGDTPIQFRNIWVRPLAENPEPVRDRRLPPR